MFTNIRQIEYKYFTVLQFMLRLKVLCIIIIILLSLMFFYQFEFRSSTPKNLISSTHYTYTYIVHTINTEERVAKLRFEKISKRRGAACTLHRVWTKISSRKQHWDLCMQTQFWLKFFTRFWILCKIWSKEQMHKLRHRVCVCVWAENMMRLTTHFVPKIMRFYAISFEF